MVWRCRRRTGGMEPAGLRKPAM